MIDFYLSPKVVQALFQITNRYGDVPMIKKDNGGDDEDCEKDDRTHYDIGKDEDDGYDVAVCTVYIKILTHQLCQPSRRC